MPDLTPTLNYDVFGPPMDEKAPVSIRVDPNTPPGTRIKDFVPSAHKLADMEAYRRGVPIEEITGPHQHGVVVEPNVTYMSNKDMKKRLEKRRGRILELAKGFYNEKKARRLEFMQAKQTVKNMTKHERTHPNKAQHRAQKILERGHPMTKEMAIAKAEKQVREEMRPR